MVISDNQKIADIFIEYFDTIVPKLGLVTSKDAVVSVIYLLGHFHLIHLTYQTSSIHFMYQSPTHSFRHSFPSHSFYR